jgi:hypothetical protein
MRSHPDHVSHAESAGWHRQVDRPPENGAPRESPEGAQQRCCRVNSVIGQAMALVSGGAPRLERDDVNESVPEVVAFLVARPRAHPHQQSPEACQPFDVRRSVELNPPNRMRPSFMPLRQHRQRPAGGPAPLGGVDLGDEQVQLTGESMDLFAESAVVIEGRVQSTP